MRSAPSAVKTRTWPSAAKATTSGPEPSGLRLAMPSAAGPATVPWSVLVSGTPALLPRGTLNWRTV